MEEKVKTGTYQVPEVSRVPLADQPEVKRKVFLWRFLVGLLILGVLGWIFWWWFGRPAKGLITKEISPEYVDLTIEGKEKTYSGKYFTFLYPASFSELSFPDPIKSPLIERAIWSTNDFQSKKLALIYQDIGNFSLSEYPGYRMRTLDPKTYQSEIIEKNGMTITLFTKNAQVFEVAAFLGKKGYAVSLVASSPVALKGLREDIFSVLDSWSWVSPHQEKK